MASRLVSSSFVARDAELARITRCVDAAAAGTANAVLIGGEAGVGKSRLVDEIARVVRARGGRVLIGGCVELGGEGFALAPIVEVVRTLARTSTAGELDRVLGTARPELAQLLPELDEPGARAQPGPVDRARLFERILGVLHRVADDGMVLVGFEDVHWADRSTLDLLSFLVRALTAAPVLVVVTYRTDELHRRHPMRPVLVEWERLRQVTAVELTRFDEAGVADQLSGILGSAASPEVVREVHHRSGGNAFLVEEAFELVRSGEEVSSSLRGLLLARVEQLGEKSLQLVRLAAVGGQRVSHRLLEAVAGLDPSAVRDALREAIDHAVLEIDRTAEGYAFRHLLVRDAILDDALPGQLVDDHRTYAQVLTADVSLAASTSVAASEIAHHWYAAHDLPNALPAAIAAARLAGQSYAFSEATQLLLRALEIWPAVPDAAARAGVDHTTLLELAADSSTRAGDDLDRARSLVDGALGAIDPLVDPWRYAFNLQRRSVIVALRRSVDAVGDLLRAADLVPPDPPTRELATILAQLARAHFWRAEWDDARASAERALAVTRAVGDVASTIDAQVTLGSALCYLERHDEGLAELRAAHEQAIGTDLVEPLLRCFVNLSDCYELIGRHADAAAAAMEGIRAAERVGLAHSWGIMLRSNAAESLMHVGSLADAEAIAEAMSPIDPGGTFGVSQALVRAEIAVRRGDLGAASDRLADVRLAGDAGWQFGLSALVVVAQLALADGDFDAARAALAPVHADDVGSETSRYAWPAVWLAMRVEADAVQARRASQPDAAVATKALAHAAGRLAHAKPPDHVHAALVAAEHARITGHDELTRWDAAARLAGALGERFEVAYCAWRSAEAHLRAGDREAAGTAAGKALDGAVEIGAAGLVDEIASFVRRARLSTGTASPGGAGAMPFGLTPRELEVLGLVAEGRTNAQIAAELYISIKTASVHVSNIIAKLGVATRGEAAAVAHRSGILGRRAGA